MIAGNYKVYYRNAGIAYYNISLNFIPFFEINGIQSTSSTLKSIAINSKSMVDTIVSYLNSSTFALIYFCYSDCYHLTNKDLNRIYLSNFDIKLLSDKCNSLMTSLKRNSIIKSTSYKTKGNVVYQELYPRYSKKEIDEIDKVLAKHYGFTEEELDFIINYDIKYRMGDELNDSE